MHFEDRALRRILAGTLFMGVACGAWPQSSQRFPLQPPAQSEPQSQPQTFVDANSPTEAIGMMASTMRIAQVMHDQCVARAPKVADELNANFLKWKTNEAFVLEKTDIHWRRMVQQQPAAKGLLVDAAADTMSKVDAIAKLQGKNGNITLADYCRRHFADLASGVWRTARTPRVYAFMDRAP